MGGVLKKKTFLIFLVFATISLGGNILLWPKAQAVITADFPVVSGTDTTSGISVELTPTQIGHLNVIGDTNVGSNAYWPASQIFFDESKYIEFVFSPNIPPSATINQILIKHIYERSGSMGGGQAKFEIWDGNSFHSETASVPTGSEYVTDNLDVSSYINTPDKVNNLKVRFLAYRGTAGNLKTYHDFIGLTVSYDSPESTSTPTPSASETPTPSESPSPTPSESPTPTPTPTTEDVSVISQTATSILQSSAIADGNFSHGWKWTFDLTVPAAEPNLALKFDDWTSETASISAGGNMHIYSPQSLNAPTPETALLITGANIYSDNLLMAGDLDGSRPGRQIQIVIEAKIPPGTIGGSYHTNYGFISSQ